MLSNYIVGQNKFVLFVDETGMERNSKTIIKNLLNEQGQSYVSNISEIKMEKNNVILDPFSKLTIFQSEKEIFRMIQDLKINENVIQIFGWISIKNIQSKVLQPFLEHMSDILVTIKSTKHLSILTKSKLKIVKLKDYQHELLNGKTFIKEIKLDKIMKEDKSTTEDIENIGTFKIGQFNANELEAKRNLKLPFEIMQV